MAWQEFLQYFHCQGWIQDFQIEGGVNDYVHTAHIASAKLKVPYGRGPALSCYSTGKKKRPN